MDEGVHSEYPRSQDWTIDRGHSRIGFMARHLMVSEIRGRFRRFEGVIHFGARPEQSSVEVTVRSDSIDSCHPRRDAHLRSADFLDADRFPTFTFRSRELTPSPGASGRLAGELTLRGVTRVVVLEVTYHGLVDDPWASRRLGFSATGEIDRRDFGMIWNDSIPGGGVMVSNLVRLEIAVEAASPGAEIGPVD
jgi:polyisoprenoid-binding protein YceI